MSETHSSFGSSSSRWDPQQELRFFVGILGILFFLSSLSLNIFLTNQNRNLQAQLKSLNDQSAGLDSALQQNRGIMENVVREVAQQVPSHPEARTILQRYNIQVQTTAPAAAPGK